MRLLPPPPPPHLPLLLSRCATAEGNSVRVALWPVLRYGFWGEGRQGRQWQGVMRLITPPCWQMAAVLERVKRARVDLKASIARFLQDDVDVTAALAIPWAPPDDSDDEDGGGAAGDGGASCAG